MTETLGTRLVHAIAAKDADAIKGLLADDVADTARVSYRFDLVNDDGDFVAEQQVYYRGDESIDYLRVLCSGFRPRNR